MQPLSELKVSKGGKLLDSYIRQCVLREVQVEMGRLQDPRAVKAARMLIDEIINRDNEW